MQPESFSALPYSNDRRRNLVSLTVVFCLLGWAVSPIRAGQLPGSSPYTETAGRIEGEAENYHAHIFSQDGSWVETASGEGTGAAFTNASNGLFMQGLPDNGTRETFHGSGPAIDYHLQVVTPGVYQLFLRYSGHDAASDSIYAGIIELADGIGGEPDWYEDSGHGSADFAVFDYDGLGGPEADVFEAVQEPMIFRFSEPGIYTLRIVPREDGVALDAWRLERLEGIGTESFSYPDGPIDGRAGGTGFDFDNSYENGTFIGRTGTTSDWEGDGAIVVDGRLVTGEGHTARRQYNGPTEGPDSGSDERASAINQNGTYEYHVVYYLFSMEREAGATWSVVSSLDFETERIAFGVPLQNGPSGQQEFGINLLEGGDAFSGIQPRDGRTYLLVAKLDFDSDLLSLWVDPDLNASEASQPPDASLVYTGGNWSTAVRFGSGGAGQVFWDNTAVATSWPALQAELAPPWAAPDAIVLNPGQKARIAVTANDGGNVDASTVEIVQVPFHGMAVASPDGSVLYTHGGKASAGDFFTYRVASGLDTFSAPAEVQVTISEAVRLPNTTMTLPDTPPPTALSLVEAYPGITFDSPTGITSAPGDTSRVYVTERAGGVYVIRDIDTSNPQKVLVLDLAAVLGSRENEEFLDDGNELGLRGLAFHPEFATNGYLYVVYSPRISGVIHDRLSRFRIPDPVSGVSDPASEQKLINFRNDESVHNIADLNFGPDGYLYVACGDEGGGNDGNSNAQRIDKDFWSGILRIDVDRKPGSLEPNSHPDIETDGSGNAHYSIPADNPFIGATSFNGIALDPTKVRTEFWAVGFRNPWQFSFDPLTGEMWVADVGQNGREEIDVVVKGGNYGWAYREGGIAGPKTPVAGFDGGIEPVWEYSRGGGSYEGFSITGGLVYRGSGLPELDGKYLFADFISGNIWTAERTAGSVIVERILGEVGIVAFHMDPSSGDILLLDFGGGESSAGAGGRVLRLADTPVAGVFPATLSQTGVFADLYDLSPNPGLVSYAPKVPFWSDHALKSRWFSVPDPAGLLEFTRDGNWEFPVGATWVKHFDMDLDRDVPGSHRIRVETRIFRKTEAGFYGVSYLWNGEGTEATLVEDQGDEFDLAITEGGGIVSQRYRIPSRASCLACHTTAGGGALSFNTRQLNCPAPVESALSDNQLLALRDAGYFLNPDEVSHPMPEFPDLDDTAVSLESRARAYLAVNCVQCHQPGGSNVLSWNGDPAITLEETGLIDGIANQNAGDPQNRLVVRGEPEHSILLHRLKETDGFSRMPPIGSTVHDAQAIQLITDWINESVSYRTYTEWRGENFGSTSSPEGDPEVDVELDGLTNGEEYLRRSDPHVFDDVNTFSLIDGTAGGTFTLRYLHPAGRQVQILSSPNLQIWTPWESPLNTTLRPATDEEVFVDLPIGGEQQFFRLRIEE